MRAPYFVRDSKATAETARAAAALARISHQASAQAPQLRPISAFGSLAVLIDLFKVVSARLGRQTPS